MPELPEVETVRRGLAGLIEGKTISNVTLARGDLRFPFPKQFAKRLKGQTVKVIERRAKYLVIHLKSSDILIVHLGMSGRFRFETAKKTKTAPLAAFYDVTPQSQKHDHVAFAFKAGERLIYNDARRFGFMELIAGSDLENRFKEMGLEPLSRAFTGKALEKALQSKKVAVKLALLDQNVVAGVGNIYACEALFDARIAPDKASGTLKPAELAKLAASIKKVLNKAIKLGGSTLRDFRHADGASGAFQHQFCVYDRAGKPCPRCGTSIQKKTQGGRSTFYCASCQK